MSVKTVIKYVGSACSLFDFAHAEGLIDTNPARGLVGALMPKGRMTTVGAKPRHSFTMSDIEAIFSSQEYKALPIDDAMRWVPLIALYSGLRMNEICQMETSDVLNIDNVPCMKVTVEVGEHQDSGEAQSWETDEENGFSKRVKTTGSIRTLPIHPHLVDAGFLSLVERVKTAGKRRVFWQIGKAKTGYYSDIFTKHFRRFLQKIGVSSRHKTFHSFRHTFRDACRSARMNDGIAFQLGGWADGRIGNKYGMGYEIAELASELRKIRYGTFEPQKISWEEMMQSPMKAW